MIIPNRQPEAPLISAILEFDAEIDEEVLEKERQVTLKNGSSIMYDTTAFNFTMMYGLEALTVPDFLNKDLEDWAPSLTVIDVDDEALMWAVEGEDDSSVSFASRLMEQDINVRIVDEDILLSTKSFSRGSVVVLAMDNINIKNLSSLIATTAKDLDISVYSLNSGYGEKDLPDWGGRHFRLLNKPQIAILGQSGFSSYDVGVSWWSLDHHLGIRHSLLDTSMIGYADLRRYNTIVMPSGYRNLSESETSALKDWIKQGGTLIAHNGSTKTIIAENTFSSVKEISDSFDEFHDYNVDLQREFLSLNSNIDKNKVNSNKVNFDFNYPWESNKSINLKEKTKKMITAETLKKYDEWQSLFMPSGAFVSGRIDSEHWLTFGTIDTLPLLYSDYPVLMSNSSSNAVVRIGELSKNDTVENYRSLNWSDVPPGNDLNVRMSGLVWPEASIRIANSAYLTQEQLGKGQIILFSGEPNFRGSSLGTNRLWLNAVVYGSGLGTTLNISL
jgi:hypothetical protein